MIIGREVERFEMIFKSKKAEFVAVYGRRRIGKTFFIRFSAHQGKKSWFCFLKRYRD